MSPLPRTAPGPRPTAPAPSPLRPRDAARRRAAMPTKVAAPSAAPPQDGGTLPAKVTAAEAMALARHCMGFREAQDGRAWRELAATLGFYLAACALLLAALANGVWAGLVLAIPAGMAVVRVFTVQHDCGHGSFFASRALNTWVGRGLGVLTFTPYDAWKRAHAMHHSSSGDLGRRGIGDVDVLTVREYEARGPWGRLAYRLYRHPLVLHVIGPPIYFIVLQRIPQALALPVRATWRSVMGLNLALLVFYGAVVAAVGPLVGLVAIVSVASVASWVGAWLFYVQHQFEDTYYEHSDEWEARVAALNGSSHYVLPGWANWLTGNIALHHIHHLNARVPGYRLTECMAAEPRLRAVSRLSFVDSLRTIGLALWDEDERRLIRFGEAGAPAAASAG